MRKLVLIAAVSVLCSCETFNETMAKTSEALKGFNRAITGKSPEEREKERRQAEQEAAKDKAEAVVVEDKGEYETITVGASSEQKVEVSQTKPVETASSKQEAVAKVEEKNSQEASHEIVETEQNNANQEYERMEF